MTVAFVKFVGLTAQTARAIEMRRQTPDETESEIIFRVFQIGDEPAVKSTTGQSPRLDVGQGIQLNVGEAAYLFLSKTDALRNRPAATASVRSSGIELDGKIFGLSRGSYIQQPMRYVQEKLKHVGADGKPMSLSAYRQWHVVREGRMVTLDSLKDPDKARQRRSNLTKMSADELLKMLNLA